MKKFFFFSRYCKSYLLPDKSKGSKRKTTIRKGTTEPVFNETLRVCFYLKSLTKLNFFFLVSFKSTRFSFTYFMDLSLE
jgi:hypothetical protein